MQWLLVLRSKGGKTSENNDAVTYKQARSGEYSIKCKNAATVCSRGGFSTVQFFMGGEMSENNEEEIPASPVLSMDQT